MDPCSLPFEVGQQVETRSFLAGYRGAWFRCKIKQFSWRNKELWQALEYIDYPDEKIHWTKLYQKGSTSKYGKQTLMVRPSYPSVYRESQMPDVNTISEVVVIVNDVWKVGDLVDWWTDNCFWSGRITEKLGEEKVKIELPPPPVGEGSSYEVFCKDLRPSLDWSVDEGWKLLIPKESKYHLCCARIVKPLNQGGSSNLIDYTVIEGKKDVQPTVGARIEHEGSLSSHISTGVLTLPDKPEHLAVKSLEEKQSKIGLNIVDHGPRKISSSDSVSSLHVQDASAQMPGNAVQMDKYDDSGSSREMKIDKSICLNSEFSDTIEAAILDLEELICRIKWLRRIVEFGTPLSDGVRPSWKFVEHLALSKPK
ncbi:uncharacterized protein LOC110421629 isoform X2 [Herrania umbratica]|uniref:Uncharacterized protein LOC110421629 isoform X2 n=1 Tax=Herrania umbratica TaxID=108875 RepID=A0A6J1AVB0_9ROSI|nr:uncharacterized protein LOC110421629 isoform X2 [Herrania umbratica]